MEDEDGVVNELIQRSCQEIVDHINANELILRLCSKHRLTFEDVSELQAQHDYQKRMSLFLKALANKGMPAFRDFLEALNETRDHKPHADLADKLHSKLEQSGIRLQDQTTSFIENCDRTQSDATPLTQRLRKCAHLSNSVIQPSCDITHSKVTIPRTHSAPPGGTLMSSPIELTARSDQQATVLVNDVFEEEDETVTGGIVTRNGVDREATYNTQHYTVSQDIVEPDTGIVATKPQDAITASTTTTATTTTTTTYKTGSLVSTLGASLLDKSLVPLPNMISLKLILLGNSGVGKTSLIQRFLQNKFLEAPTTIGSAHGTCYIRHTLWKVNIKLSLWDTAGQEKFDWITPNYLKAVNVALIVFDMTDQEKNSLRSVGDWRNQLHQQCQGDIPIVLVGNKSDSEVMADKIKKHAKHVVEKSGLKCFIETSAKSGYQVEKVFETAISLALEYCNIPKPDVPELDTITGCNQTLNQDERTSCCKKCEIM